MSRQEDGRCEKIKKNHQRQKKRKKTMTSSAIDDQHAILQTIASGIANSSSVSVDESARIQNKQILSFWEAGEGCTDCSQRVFFESLQTSRNSKKDGWVGFRMLEANDVLPLAPLLAKYKPKTIAQQDNGVKFNGMYSHHLDVGPMPKCVFECDSVVVESTDSENLATGTVGVRVRLDVNLEGEERYQAVFSDVIFLDFNKEGKASSIQKWCAIMKRDSSVLLPEGFDGASLFNNPKTTFTLSLSAMTNKNAKTTFGSSSVINPRFELFHDSVEINSPEQNIEGECKGVCSCDLKKVDMFSYIDVAFLKNTIDTETDVDIKTITKEVAKEVGVDPSNAELATLVSGIVTSEKFITLSQSAFASQVIELSGNAQVRGVKLSLISSAILKQIVSNKSNLEVTMDSILKLKTEQMLENLKEESKKIYESQLNKVMTEALFFLGVVVSIFIRLVWTKFKR